MGFGCLLQIFWRSRSDSALRQDGHLDCVGEGIGLSYDEDLSVVVALGEALTAGRKRVLLAWIPSEMIPLL